MPVASIEDYYGNGIFIAWDWVGNESTVATAKIYRSDYGRMNGPWEEVDEIDFPENSYIDEDGTVDSYYYIEELDSLGAVVTTQTVFYGEESLLLADVYYEILPFLHLRAKESRLRFNRTRTVGFSAMGNWNYEPPPIVEINAPNAYETGGLQQLDKVELIYSTTDTGNDYPTGLKYNVDFNGKVFFYDGPGNTVAIQPYDDVFVTYQFKLITTRDINRAARQSLHEIVAQPGANKITEIYQAPIHWDAAIVYGAAGRLLKQIALYLTVPEPSVFFSFGQRDPDEIRQDAKSAFDNINKKSQEYLERFDKMKEKLAIERYPMTGVIVTPEFQLPGGRSRFFRSLWKSS